MELFDKFFSIFNHYFKYDLKYSLLIGKEYDIIYENLRVFNVILSSYKTDKEKEEILLLYKDLIETYTNKIELIFEERNSFKEIKINQTLFEFAYKIFDELLDKFIISYKKLTHYTNADYHTTLLIEVHNFFSHLLKYIQSDDKKNQNLKRAISHLYRGALDGYKEIIVQTNEIILANKILRDRFFQIRMMEANQIGEKSHKNKIEILKNYDNLINDILTIVNIDKGE